MSMKQPSDVPIFVINREYEEVRTKSSKIPATIFSPQGFTETGYKLGKEYEGKLALIYEGGEGFIGLAKIKKIFGKNEAHTDRVNENEYHIRFEWGWRFPRPISYRDFQKKLWESDTLDLKKYEKNTPQFSTILSRDRIPYFSKNDLWHLLCLVQSSKDS